MGGQIKIEVLMELLKDKLKAKGLPEDHAKAVADVYVRANYRGVGHHDINDFLSRIKQLEKGQVNHAANLSLRTEFGGLESWDGDNGLGELCAWHVTKRSMALAKEHGIGFATIANSNHFLAAAPYSDIADEEGFMTLIMSKSPSGVSLQGLIRTSSAITLLVTQLAMAKSQSCLIYAQPILLLVK